MGLLDDAIREHLELKRQHGGDPSEIQRQEQEAFGPGGRRTAPAEDAAAPAAEAAGDAPIAPDEDVTAIQAPAEPPPEEEAIDPPADAEAEATAPGDAE